ncbi:MAG TPA: pilus assembly protein [Pirellulaceae bacterium]|nr:pilus assembly protein [Pirellulaceae bacterium]
MQRIQNKSGVRRSRWTESRRGTEGDRDCQRQGAAAVECAIIMPIVLVFFLGICELGQGVNARATLVAAVRESGRLACMDFSDLVPVGMTANQKIEQDLNRILLASNVPLDQVTIRIVHAEGSQIGQTFVLDDPDNYLKLFRLEVTVPYSALSSYPLRHLMNRDISASITFRRGRVNMST